MRSTVCVRVGFWRIILLTRICILPSLPPSQKNPFQKIPFFSTNSTSIKKFQPINSPMNQYFKTYFTVLLTLFCTKPRLLPVLIFIFFCSIFRRKLLCLVKIKKTVLFLFVLLLFLIIFLNKLFCVEDCKKELFSLLQEERLLGATLLGTTFV